MSENGPREGTRDLPRSGPDAGRRAVDDTSAAGAAYKALHRRARQRREELVALVRSGLSPESVAREYSARHPLERAATVDEVESAAESVKTPTEVRRVHSRSDRSA
jgi:hypothetical protein